MNLKEVKQIIGFIEGLSQEDRKFVKQLLNESQGKKRGRPTTKKVRHRCTDEEKRQILQLRTEGKSYSEIRNELGISEAVVGFHARKQAKAMQ